MTWASALAPPGTVGPVSQPGRPLPSRRDRRRRSRAATLRRAAGRGVLAVLLAALVVALVWKVGRLAPAPSAAPAVERSAPSVTPLPSYAAGSTAGAVAPDFPAATVPVVEGTSVVSSSSEPVGDGSHLQVSLGLRTDRTAKDVVAAYAAVWKSAGFERTADKKVAGAAAAATYRKPEATPKSGGKVGTVQLADYLTIAVVDSGRDRLVTISGQVAAPTPAAGAPGARR